MCLVLVGMFFARRHYRMKLLTIAVMAGNLAGGADKVVALAKPEGLLFKVQSEPEFRAPELIREKLSMNSPSNHRGLWICRRMLAELSSELRLQSVQGFKSSLEFLLPGAS